MIEVTLYAYQIEPGSDELLCFAESLEKCRAAAAVQRKDMWEGEPEEYDQIGAMALHECVMRVGDLSALADLLNDPTDVVERLLVSKRLVSSVAD
jgi:hypothetical protein